MIEAPKKKLIQRRSKLDSPAAWNNLLCQLALVSHQQISMRLIRLFIEASTEIPEEEYEIEYVYGFRTFDCRQNMYFKLLSNSL